MKNYLLINHRIRSIFLNISVIIVIASLSCDREPISSGFPNVITLSAVDQTDMIVFSGELKNMEDISIDEVGFIWQNGEDPFSKPGFRIKAEQSGPGNFNSEISWSLSNDKNYVLRAYAKCGTKMVYGEKLDFRTSLTKPCQLIRIEPDSAFRGDTIRFIGKGFNQTLQYNKVYVDGRSALIAKVNDSILTCVVPVELTKGSKAVSITVNGIGGDFTQKFKLLLPPPPHAITKSAQNIKWFSARAEGSVDPNGLSCMVTFEYGLTTNYGLSINAVPGTVSGSATDVSASLTNLSPVSTYHYRIKAVSESGTSYSEDMSFTTLEMPLPQVVTKDAQNVQWFSARVEGSVNPRSFPCAATFEYGFTTSYGLSVNAVPGTVTGDFATNVSATLTNLSPVSTYHYRIKAVSESGTSYGEDMSFTTSEVPPMPVISSLSATSIKYGNVLTVNGQNLNSVTSVLIGSITQSVTVTPINWTATSLDIEIYNQQNPAQLLGFTSFCVGLVYSDGVNWSDPVTIGSSWTRVADLPAAGRYKAGSFVIGGNIYLGCGASDGVTLKDFWKYNPLINTWSRMADFPGVTRIYAMGAADNSSGYMGAGNTADNSTRVQLYDFYKYNPGTDAWLRIADYPDQINGFFFNYSVSINGRTFFSLSNVVQNTREIVSDAFVSRPNVTDLMDSPSNSVFVIGDSYYVVTGNRTNNTANRAVWQYNTVTSTWTRKADFPGPARNATMFFSIGNYGYMGCGATYTGQQYKDIWRYDPANDKWIRMEDFPPGVRSHTASLSVGGAGYAGLGVNLAAIDYYKDFWKFDPQMH